MNSKTVALIAILAFALGFYASEYRHTNTTRAVQSIAVADIETASLPPAGLSSAPAVGVERMVDANDAVPASASSALERAKQFISAGAYGDATYLLNQLLAQNPQHTEALWLLARLFEQQGQHQQSVATWLRYINTEIDAQKIENALLYLAQYLTRLAQNPAIFGEGVQWLIEQINALIKLTPDNGELHLQLAQMHLNAEDKEQAQYHALMAANQSATRIRAEGILAKLDEGTMANSGAPEMTVPLIRFGSQFLVPVTIEGLPVKLLLDTGASISGLTAGFINRHYSLVKSSKPIQLNTASGTVDSYLFVVDTFVIETITFNKHMLARLPMDNAEHFDGLLGVDILGRFDFVIDQDKAVLRLRKRE